MWPRTTHRTLGLIMVEGIVGEECVAVAQKGHRYPVEVISHCVWLYFRFPLSFREVEKLMLQHGVVASYETVPAVVPTVRAGLCRQAAPPPPPPPAPARDKRRAEMTIRFAIWDQITGAVGRPTTA